MQVPMYLPARKKKVASAGRHVNTSTRNRLCVRLEVRTFKRAVQEAVRRERAVKLFQCIVLNR